MTAILNQDRIQQAHAGNLIVADVERSLTFYTNVLGFERGFTVPEQSPFVFGSSRQRADRGSSSTSGRRRRKGIPAFAGKPLGVTGTMYIEAAGSGNIERLHDRLKTAVPVVMPLVRRSGTA